jgi:hypothetical protein
MDEGRLDARDIFESLSELRFNPDSPLEEEPKRLVEWRILRAGRSRTKGGEARRIQFASQFVMLYAWRKLWRGSTIG